MHAREKVAPFMQLIARFVYETVYCGSFVRKLISIGDKLVSQELHGFSTNGTGGETIRLHRVKVGILLISIDTRIQR